MTVENFIRAFLYFDSTSKTLAVVSCRMIDHKTLSFELIKLEVLNPFSELFYHFRTTYSVKVTLVEGIAEISKHNQ